MRSKKTAAWKERKGLQVKDQKMKQKKCALPAGFPITHPPTGAHELPKQLKPPGIESLIALAISMQLPAEAQAGLLLIG